MSLDMLTDFQNLIFTIYAADLVTTVPHSVRSITCQVWKTMDGMWHYHLAIGYSTSNYYYHSGEKDARWQAIEELRIMLSCIFDRVPEKVTLRIGLGSAIPFPTSSKRPYQKEIN